MGVFTSPYQIHSVDPVFDRWWSAQGVWVEPPNQRRGGESGVQILQQQERSSLPLYIKRQTGHIYRTFAHPFGRPTILREREVYLALSKVGVKTPRLIYSDARKLDGEWQALLITEALDGYVNLAEWYANGPSKQINDLLIRELAATLARMHKSGWQHGCCYPKHIFVRAVPDSQGAVRIDIALLDLEKSRRRWSAKKAASKDLAQLTRHREQIPLDDLSVLYRLHREYLQQSGPTVDFTVA